LCFALFRDIAGDFALAVSTLKVLCVSARVRVKRSVSNPTYGWGSVAHDKVGIVKRVDPDGDLKVDYFPSTPVGLAKAPRWR
jgi:hypothetical protein